VEGSGVKIEILTENVPEVHGVPNSMAGETRHRIRIVAGERVIESEPMDLDRATPFQLAGVFYRLSQQLARA
jgi:hypothetical protein